MSDEKLIDRKARKMSTIQSGRPGTSRVLARRPKSMGARSRIVLCASAGAHRSRMTSAKSR